MSAALIHLATIAFAPNEHSVSKNRCYHLPASPPQTPTQTHTLPANYTSFSSSYFHKQRPNCLKPFSTTNDTTQLTVSDTKKIPFGQYLAETLSFSNEEILEATKRLLAKRKINLDWSHDILICKDNADSIVSYLQDENNACRLTHSQVKILVIKYPSVLNSNIEKVVKPKIKTLQDACFSTTELADILATNPAFCFERDLSFTLGALRQIMGSDVGVVKVLKKFKWGSVGDAITNNLIPNFLMLENEYGIPREKLLKFLVSKPSPFFRRTAWLRDILVRIEDKWGISRDSAYFSSAVYVFCSRGEDNINSKCQVFKSFGFSETDILTMIRSYPSCLGHSETKIKKSLKYCMNELGYHPAYIASRSLLLGFNVENRLIPRQRVLSILKEKRLVKASYQLLTAATLTEDMFFERLIFPYEKYVPQLRELYVNEGGTGEARSDEAS